MRKRECSACPPWTLFCAHHPSGVVLRLNNDRHPALKANHLRGRVRYIVLGPAAITICRCGEHDILDAYDDSGYWSDNLALSIAEFRRREEALRLEPRP